jgi:hypothetical protein
LGKEIQPLIVIWVVKKCVEAPESPAEEWQRSVAELIEAQRSKYMALVEEVPLTPP